jgi:hypothetical protein
MADSSDGRHNSSNTKNYESTIRGIQGLNFDGGDAGFTTSISGNLTGCIIGQTAPHDAPMYHCLLKLEALKTDK